MSDGMDFNHFKKFELEFLKNIKENELSAFKKLTCDEDRIKFVYDIPLVHSYHIVVGKNLKSLESAKHFKEEGNRAFQVYQYHAALDLYTQSIIKQPQDTISHKEELSVIFANRSAALYHIKDYKSAMEDIKAAFDLGYPSHLQCKIYDRKARCLLALNQLKSAQEAFRQTIQSLDAAKLTAERKQKWQKDIQIMLAILDKNKQLTNAPLNTASEKAQFKDGVNKHYPQASSSVTIKEDPLQGRFAEANNDINPGDLLIRESPHCAVLLDQYSKTHCFQCFKRAKAPSACHHCSSVVFCSTSCRDAALASHHGVECSVLPALWQSGVSVTVLMALRIVSQRTLDHFLQIRPTLGKSNKNQTYKSDDYRSVYNLVNHESQRSPEDLLRRSFMAVFLLRCLQSTNYFGKHVNVNEEKNLSGNDCYIGALILRHLQSLQFNSHEVSELVIEEKNKTSVFIGGAVYPTLALFNHSCNPGIVRYHKGTEVVARAIRTIRSGEIVAENYGPIFTQVERGERQRTLRTQYWFDCACEACLENWPTLDCMPSSEMRFRCECGSIILVPVDTLQFMLPCPSCNQHTNILKGLKVLQDTDMMFRVAKSLLEEGKSVAALHKFLELLMLLDSTLAPPFKDYHLCQQELRMCMLSCGNINKKQ